MPLIQIRSLTKIYRMGDSEVRALDGVDLDVERGEFIAITGASGSGKSTMMHLMGCLDRPTAGSYVLRGRDVSNLSDGDLAAIRNHEIGFVFQTFNLINRTTALDNVGVPLFYARKGNTRGPALKALERVGLDHRAHHKPSELSGGERQRVAIARAIVTQPAFLLADEPTGNLDSKTGDQIMEIFHSLNAQGVTIVLVTHEPDIAAQAQRIVQMRDGRIVADRSRDEWLREMTAAARVAPVVATGAHGGATAVAPNLTGAAAAPVEVAVDLPGLESATAYGTPRYSTAVPAARVAAPQSAAPAPLPSAAVVHRRRAPGATAALMTGLISIVCYLGILGTTAILIAKGLPMQNATQKDYEKLGPIAGIVMISNLMLILGGIVLGIVAICFGIGAIRRIRKERAAYYGLPRSIIGLICGILAVGLPLLGITLAVVGMLRGAAKPA